MRSVWEYSAAPDAAIAKAFGDIASVPKRIKTFLPSKTALGGATAIKPPTLAPKSPAAMFARDKGSSLTNAAGRSTNTYFRNAGAAKSTPGTLGASLDRETSGLYRGFTHREGRLGGTITTDSGKIMRTGGGELNLDAAAKPSRKALWARQNPEMAQRIQQGEADRSAARMLRADRMRAQGLNVY